jgi:hypothetical protein
MAGLNIVARQQTVNNLPVLVHTGGLLIALQDLTTKNLTVKEGKHFYRRCVGKQVLQTSRKDKQREI